VIEPNLDTSLA